MIYRILSAHKGPTNHPVQNPQKGQEPFVLFALGSFLLHGASPATNPRPQKNAKVIPLSTMPALHVEMVVPVAGGTT